MDGAPETTLVVRTFNEAEHLPALMEALERQRYRDFELVVVDSGSWDETREIANRYADQVIRIDSHDFTFGYSLNVGVRKGRGRFIAMASAHTVPMDDGWLGALVAPLRERNVAMSYGCQRGNHRSKIGELHDLERTFGSRRFTMEPPRFFANNANAAVRRDLWDEHPFDERLPGLEDIEWAKFWMEQGFQVIYEPLAALFHIHEESWRQVRRRYFREALAARRIGVKSVGNVVTDLIREGYYLFDDVARFVVRGEEGVLWPSSAVMKEILLFRINKAVGHTRGLLSGPVMENQKAREEMFFDRTCDAVVIEGAGRAVLKRIAIPELKPGEVLIKVSHVGVCATDLELVDGTLGYYRDGIADYPIVPGHEMSGRVMAFGPNVSGLAEGQSVVVECIQGCGSCGACRRGNPIGCEHRKEMGVIGKDGAYSEFVVAASRFVHPLDDGIDMETAALCEPLAVVLKGLRRLSGLISDKDRPMNCAVVGGGPLGNLCAQVLRQRGHEVTVIERSAARRRYLEALPVKVSGSMDGLPAMDVIVEATGNVEALDVVLSESGSGAVILLLGLPYAHRSYTFENIVAYDKVVVGSVGSNGEDFREAIGLLKELDFRCFTEKVLPLAEYQDAWVLTRKQSHLKVLLAVDGGGEAGTPMGGMAEVG